MRAMVPETVALVPKAVRLPATAPVTRLLLRGRGNLVKKTTLETIFGARLRTVSGIEALLTRPTTSY
jgi:hypothetical protein